LPAAAFQAAGRLKAGGSQDCFDLRGAIQRLEAEPLGPRNDWNENLIPT
jgi:hypothetical protein